MCAPSLHSLPVKSLVKQIPTLVQCPPLEGDFTNRNWEYSYHFVNFHSTAKQPKVALSRLLEPSYLCQEKEMGCRVRTSTGTILLVSGEGDGVQGKDVYWNHPTCVRKRRWGAG